MEHRIPGSQTQRDLPMVVYLQGDEEFLEDFEVDAEKAMDFLGIKRSRLTQISGRELRVGRIRRDRYIRPVYRVKDLEDYKTWTRATATSQSSSKVMEEAIQSLSGQWNEFKLESQFVLRDTLAKLSKDASEERLLQKKLLDSKLSKVLRELDSIQTHIQKPLKTLEESLSHEQVEQKIELQKIKAEVGTLNRICESLHLDVHTILQGIKSSDEKFRLLLEEIHKVQQSSVADRQETNRIVEGLGQKIDALEKQIEKKKEETTGDLIEEQRVPMNRRRIRGARRITPSRGLV